MDYIFCHFSFLRPDSIRSTELVIVMIIITAEKTESMLKRYEVAVKIKKRPAVTVSNCYIAHL